MRRQEWVCRGRRGRRDSRTRQRPRPSGGSGGEEHTQLCDISANLNNCLWPVRQRVLRNVVRDKRRTKLRGTRLDRASVRARVR